MLIGHRVANVQIFCGIRKAMLDILQKILQSHPFLIS